MKKALVTLILILISQIVYSKNYQYDFKKYLKNNDTINPLKTLKEWEINSPQDAELYTSFFNYYFINRNKRFLN